MNGKTARKLLRRGRNTSFWGRRAFFTVRIPLDAIPEPLPEFDAKQLGDPGAFQGYFERFADGRRYLTNISEVHGGRPDKQDGKAFFVEKDSNDDERAWYRWWEGRVIVYDEAAYRAWDEDKSNPRTVPHPEPIETYDLDEAIVGAYRARRKWFDRYVHQFAYPESHPLRRFGEASWWSKTQYGNVHGRYLYLTYSVKYFYRNRADGFANAVARAVKTAKRAGIPVRVV